MRTYLGLSRWQLIITFVLAAVLVVMAFLQNQPKTVVPYDPDDASSLGLRALVLWLKELDYAVTINRYDSTPAAQVDLFWIHTSQSGFPDSYTESEIADIYRWIEAGGTLVLVGPAVPYSPLSAAFGVQQIETVSGVVSDIRQVQPLLPDAPDDWSSFFGARSLEFAEDHPIVPVLAHSNGAPVVALQFIGDGVIWHLTEDFALTNLNLRDERVAALLPAILRTIPTGAQVAFSTQHLGYSSPDEDRFGGAGTLQEWLYTTPFGQATLLLMVALFVFLLLQGRRLGPALPGPTATRPRVAAEYVTALAGLQRRTRHPRVVANHHRQRLKNAIGRMTQVPASLPDQQWVTELSRTDVLPPTLVNQIIDLLAGYAKIQDRTSDEADLIPLVQATDALLASLPRANLQLVR
jgi:hypothetical protein